VVDTQSGFLVVIKRIDSRLALSVKRRLGTPPVSSILLTPDESLKLSRILGGSTADGSPQKYRASTLIAPSRPRLSPYDDSQQNEDDLNGEQGPSGPTSLRGERSQLADEPDPRPSAAQNYAPIDERTEGIDESDATSLTETAALSSKSSRSSRTWDILLGSTKSSDKGSIGGLLLICLLGGAVTVGVAGASIWFLKEKRHAVKHEAPVASAQILESRFIDKFSRDYVLGLLDFNPSTYRYSQVRAMAAMTPELMAKYWQETHFPLPLSQLAIAGRKQSVVISNVEQKPSTNSYSHEVDVFANLTCPDQTTDQNPDQKPDQKTDRKTDKKDVSAVQLRLTIEKEQDGSYKVSKQADVSSSAK